MAVRDSATTPLPKSQIPSTKFQTSTKSKTQMTETTDGNSFWQYRHFRGLLFWSFEFRTLEFV
jgi:hypothetical protein